MRIGRRPEGCTDVESRLEVLTLGLRVLHQHIEHIERRAEELRALASYLAGQNRTAPSHREAA